MMRKRSTESSAPRTVLLRLSRGVSTHVTWLLRSSPSAATVTLGSDASCDWQVHARDVPGHALSVALFDGGLYVASGPRALVLLDGEPLPEVWQRVDHELSIEIGEARLELVWEQASDSVDGSSERDRPTFPDMVGPAVLVDSDAERSAPARASWVGRVSRTSWLDSPTLLGRVAETRSSAQLLRYALLILFTALAYRAWLLLLDRI
jgi:hypothetical protein